MDPAERQGRCPGIRSLHARAERHRLYIFWCPTHAHRPSGCTGRCTCDVKHHKFSLRLLSGVRDGRWVGDGMVYGEGDETSCTNAPDATRADQRWPVSLVGMTHARICTSPRRPSVRAAYGCDVQQEARPAWRGWAIPGSVEIGWVGLEAGLVWGEGYGVRGTGCRWGQASDLQTLSPCGDQAVSWGIT